MANSILKFRSEHPFTPEGIRDIREDLLRHCLERGLQKEDGWDLASLFDELCCNIIDHGQASWFEVEVTVESDGKPRMTIRDDGTAFNPAQHPSLPTSYERGLGLELVHQQAKDIQYQRCESGVNELTLVTAN